jgi:sterol desaturase/sphingolipid hydroxylase (fatty acid hydroxylase superfamily)
MKPALEPVLRLGVFAAMFAVMALWEALAPRRRLVVGRVRRWPRNLALVILDNVCLRALFPTAAIGVALVAEARGWGIFAALPVPRWLAFGASLILLDLAIYTQHVLFHLVPPLWRLHRVHHADPDFDVTTGVRFHPGEIVLSLLIKFAVIIALGAPAGAVFAFELILNATALFNHANARLPMWLDRWLRLVVVTPDMHRVHHSVIRRETDSNFGFNLPWWDRLFGTYRAAPEAGQAGMRIGLEEFADPAELALWRTLLQPFRNPNIQMAGPGALPPAESRGGASGLDSLVNAPPPNWRRSRSRPPAAR